MTELDLIRSIAFGLRVLGRNEMQAEREARYLAGVASQRYPYGIPETSSALRNEYAHAARKYGAFK